MCLQFVKNDNNGISQTEVAYGESTYYKKATEYIYKAARAISAFWKTHSCKLITNWTRNRMITITNIRKNIYIYILHVVFL